MPKPRRPLTTRIANALPGLSIARPRLTLLLTGLLLLVGIFGLTRLHEEEDILSFLPSGEPDVGTFQEVAHRFGALRVALIGVEPPDGQPLFSADLLGRLDRLSTALENLSGVDHVLSLSNMLEPSPSAAELKIRKLIPRPIPTDPTALQQIERRALSLPQVRGNVLSADGKATLLLVFLSEGKSTRQVAMQARALAHAELGAAHVYFGGAPFAGQAIYDATQSDVRWLTPISLLIFFIVVLLSFRDWLSVLLCVGTVAVAGIVVTGGMGLLHEPFTVVTAMLPVVLFAAGSQYAIHFLGRYFIVRSTPAASSFGSAPIVTSGDAARRSLSISGPPVTIAASATALGFLSFLVMNVQPMRAFGVTCAAGIFICWLLAMTVLPAVVTRWPRPSEKPFEMRALANRMEKLWGLAQRKRLPILTGAAVLLVLCGRYTTQVTVRMEPSAFFQKGSEPARAQAFLDSRFGGSQFVQIAVQGDVLDPLALREIARLSAYAHALPGVTQVQSIVDPLVIVNAAFTGGKGVPSRREQIGNLLLFVMSDKSIKALLSEDQHNALINVRIAGDTGPALAGLEAYLGPRWPYALSAASHDDLAEEITWLLPAALRHERSPAITEALKQVHPLSTGPPDARAFRDAALEVLAHRDGDEEAGLSAATRAALLAALQGGHDGARDANWLRKARPGGISEGDIEVFLGQVEERAAGTALQQALQAATDRLLAAAQLEATADHRSAVEQVALVLLNPVPGTVSAASSQGTGDNPAEPALARLKDGGRPGGANDDRRGAAAQAPSGRPWAHVGPGASGQAATLPIDSRSLTGRLSGEPVLDRGFSRAVERNQWASLRVSLLAVFVLLLLSLRSVGAALICILPAGLSLLAVFGTLGFFHKPIDIGTSLVGSIVAGSGADFAMHYIWYLGRLYPKEVVRSVGPILFITAGVLAAGLGVLTLGSSPPLRLFGALASAGILLSATFTFLLVPALVRKTSRREFG